MFFQILIGSIINILSIFLLVGFVEFAVYNLKRFNASKFEHQHSARLNFFVSLSIVAFWLWIAMSLMIWVWTFLLYGMGAFETLEENFYFALVAFTTLGFGDVLLPDEMRLYAGFIAANGFLLFGLNTALLMESIIRLRKETA